MRGRAPSLSAAATMQMFHRDLLLSIFFFVSFYFQYSWGEEVFHPGDTFPSCIHVVAVYPPPKSLLVPDSKGRINIDVVFTKSVQYVRRRQRIHRRLEFVDDAYLTPSLARMEKIGRLISTEAIEDTWHIRSYVFQLTEDEIQITSKLYLIIDGEQLYYLQKVQSGLWDGYVPLTIIGEYYVDPKLAVGKTPQQIERMTHCDIRLKRPLPDPFYDDFLKAKLSLSIVPDQHTVEQKKSMFELSLLVKAFGVGDGSIVLPQRVKAVYYNTNLTVKIPSGSVIRIKRGDNYYRVPVQSKILHEVFERVYHTRRVLPMTHANYQFANFQASNKRDLLHLTCVNNPKTCTIKTVQTNFLLSIGVVPQSVYYSYYSREGGIWRDKANPWDRSGRGGRRFYDRKYDTPPFYSKICNADSVRTRTTMQKGLTVHMYELGPYYRLLIPDLAATGRWVISSRTRVYSQARDVTRISSFGVPNSRNKRVPKFLYDAMKNYVALVRPVSEVENSKVIIPLDEGIFVPRGEMHKECGGILLFENKNYNGGDDFCEKKFGSCTGLPWTSMQRFPVIPPFNIPDLAGWTDNRQKMDPVFFGEAFHPISRHFNNTTVPRSFYYAGLNQRFIYLSAPDISTDYITIPVSGVTALIPNFLLSDCNRIWYVEKVLTREATLTIYFNNTGSGGADVTVKLQCTADLIILPSTGEKTQWVEPLTNDRITFKLDATLAATKRMETHFCHVGIKVHTIQEAAVDKICSRVAIRTYAGLFQDPCKLEETPLPGINLKYFVLPRSQLNDSFAATINTLISNSPQELLFMRAIAVSLTATRKQYLSNLLKTTVNCENPNVFVFEEEDATNQALLLLLNRIKKASLWNKEPITFFSSLLKTRRYYFFAVRNWVLYSNATGNATSGCSIKVLANRPHKLCSKQETVNEAYVPLIQSDIGDITRRRRGEFWYVEPIYGNQPKPVIILLFVCIGILVFCSLITGSGHAVMFVYRKQLPSLKKKLKLVKQLKQLKAKTKKTWETPQMFLEEGKHGPYYTLYNFKCTNSLSTTDLKSLKVAGLLAYKEKELQVLFGHIKKVYLDTDSLGDIWLQASSGWYLLQPHNVNSDYTEQLNDFYDQHDIEMHVGL